ncbi:hypothetical protein ACHAWU_010050 [Discostella pseudostelligera]|uniref:C3H1-type domain-containing protein n=1 Tax=Discostella pseudostelligera TaxID=259834 RepID=A0ABD3N6L0_9STRA
MGIRVREIGGQGMAQRGQIGQANLLATTANAVQNMGNQMVAGLQAAITASAQQNGGAGGDGGSGSGLGGFGKKYSRSHIAQLKGFCGSDDVRRIPAIWHTFSTSKDFDSYRVEIEKRMEKWGRDKGVEIDYGMYLEDDSLKAIAQLQFNPSGSGAGVALAQSADKGLSILLCRPRTIAEVERLRDNEQATATAAQTVTVDQAKKIKPGTVCKPPNGTYLELRLLIGTYCGLLYTLFGSGCDYYHELRKIHAALLAREVAAIREAFTVDKCRRIIWAIIDDGRAFFRQKMAEADFSDPEGYTFRTSLLSAIGEKVRFANVIERPFYPQAWEIRPVMSGDGGGSTRGRTGGGSGGGGGGSGGTRNTSGAGPSGGAESGSYRRGGGGASSGNMAPATGSGGWTDDRHPTIKAMMREYEATTGLGLRINLGRVLNTAGREIRDLPVIPEYVENGRPFICWAHILGRCHFGSSCTFSRGHPPRRDILDAFAREVVGLFLEGAITTMVAEQRGRQPAAGSPPKKQKGGDAE